MAFWGREPTGECAGQLAQASSRRPVHAGTHSLRASRSLAQYRTRNLDLLLQRLGLVVVEIAHDVDKARSRSRLAAADQPLRGLVVLLGCFAHAAILEIDVAKLTRQVGHVGIAAHEIFIGCNRFRLAVGVGLASRSPLLHHGLVALVVGLFILGLACNAAVGGNFGVR